MAAKRIPMEPPLISAATSRLSALERTRDKISMMLDDSHDARSVAALTVQLRGVLAEIDAITPLSVEVCHADRIAARRAERHHRERSG